jgi:hypothetical protein
MLSIRTELLEKNEDQLKREYLKINAQNKNLKKKKKKTLSYRKYY